MLLDAARKAYWNRQREQHYRRHHWRNLAEVCAKLEKLAPDDRGILHDLAVALGETGQREPAREVLKRLLKVVPKVPIEHQHGLEGARYLRYLLVLSDALVADGRLELARQVLEPLKKLGPDVHKKYELLSDIAQRQGRLAAAAGEIDEMLDAYADSHFRQFGPRILLRTKELLDQALEKKDAEAAFVVLRTRAKYFALLGELKARLKAGGEGHVAPIENTGLAAWDALLTGAPDQAEEHAAKLDWPELAACFLIRVRTAQGRHEEAFSLLERLPAESPLRMEQLNALRPRLFGEPVFLRRYAESLLSAGRVEEAFEALQALTLHSACGLEDLELQKDLRLLLLERNIWEDELRLSMSADSQEITRLPALVALTRAAELPFRGRTLPVRLSGHFRRAAERHQAPEPVEIRLRLAENYLRGGSRPERGIAILQELSRGESPCRKRALFEIAQHYARLGEAEVARAAIARWKEAAPPSGEAADQRMYLELGLACEAAGWPQEAKDLYGALVAFDVNQTEAAERLRCLRSSPAGRSADGQLATARLRSRFADLQVLGRGGMGVVYRAVDVLFQRPVALKVLSEQFQADADAVQRFVREGQVLAQLNHPGIARIYELNRRDDLYIAMELVEGESLRALLQRQKRLPSDELRGLGLQVCEALSFAHRHDVLHRDVKPDNALVASDGRLKLVDFGLATLANATALTQKGAVMGTGRYMSPEQIRGQELDARSDIYSLGVTLYELASGEVPFPSGDIGYRQVHEAPAPLREKTGDCSERFAEVVMRCLEKDPAKRYSSCPELASALQEAR